MDERLRQGVHARASNRCEYCGLPQTAEPFFAYHIEHIVARQHDGSDDLENLACYHCNARKGPNLSALLTRRVARSCGCFARARTLGSSISSVTGS